MKHLKTLFVFMLTLLLGIGQMWAETITLTESDVHSYTSYNTSEQTFTNGVSFGFINAMTNNSNGTPSGWAKNQVIQTKSGGYIYNKGSLSTIQHVKVWQTGTTSFNVGYGTAEKPTTNKISKSNSSVVSGTEQVTYSSYTSNGKVVTPGQTTTVNTYDFDLSSYDATHFCIIPGGSMYIWKVEITYESAAAEPNVFFASVLV